MSKNIVVVIHITGADGQILDLPVRENDDPTLIGKQFLDKNILPPQLLPVIVQKIVDSVIEASRERVRAEEERRKEYEYEQLKNNPGKPRAKSIAIKRRGQMSSSSSKRGSSSAAIDKIYNSRLRYETHKKELQHKYELQKEESILKSDFRYQLSLSPSRWKAHHAHTAHVHRDGDYFQSMYEDHVKWDKERRQHIERLRQSLAEKKRAEEEKACRPQPRLFSSPEMRLPPSPTPTAVFEGLYNWSKRGNRGGLSRSWSEGTLESAGACSFSPTLCKKSVVLARRRIGRSRSLSPAAKVLDYDGDGMDYDREEKEFLSPPSPRVLPLPATEFHPLSLPLQDEKRSPLDIDSSVIDRLREVDLPHCSTAASSHTAALYSPPLLSPYSHKKLSLPPVLVDEVSAVSPLSEATLGEREEEEDVKGVQVSSGPSPSLPVSSLPLPENVFERLYQEREEQRIVSKVLRERHCPSFPFQPDLSLTQKENRKEREGEGGERGDRFERLYEHRLVKIDRENQMKIELDKKSMEERRVVSEEKRKETIDRLYLYQIKAQEKKEKVLQREEQSRERRASPHYTTPASHTLLLKRQFQSLHEIFDVLLVTAEYQKAVKSEREEHVVDVVPILSPSESSAHTTSSQEDEPEQHNGSSRGKDRQKGFLDASFSQSVRSTSSHVEGGMTLEEISSSDLEDSPPATPTRSKNPFVSPNKDVVAVSSPSRSPQKQQAEELLDSTLADASLLQPHSLATAIGKALAALRPRKINRQEFVEKVLGMVQTSSSSKGVKGGAGQMHRLLCPSSKRSERKEKAFEQYTQEGSKEYTFKPVLRAEKATSKMAKERYQNAGENVPERLLQYGFTYHQNWLDLSEEVIKEQMKECTFKPQSFARAMKEASDTHREIQRRKRLQSNAAGQYPEYSKLIRPPLEIPREIVTSEPLAAPPSSSRRSFSLPPSLRLSLY